MGKPIVLTSGKISGYYIDHRAATSDVRLSKAIVDALTEKTKTYMSENDLYSDSTFIVSSADAGIYWGARVAGNVGLPWVGMRKNENLLGAIPANTTGICVDDLNTTYSTFIKVLKMVEKHDAEVEQCFVNVDRVEAQKKMRDVVESYGAKLEANVTGHEIIRHGIDNGHIQSDDIDYLDHLLRAPNDFALEAIASGLDNITKGRERIDKALEYYKGNEEVYAALDKQRGFGGPL